MVRFFRETDTNWLLRNCPTSPQRHWFSFKGGIWNISWMGRYHRASQNCWIELLVSRFQGTLVNIGDEWHDGEVNLRLMIILRIRTDQAQFYDFDLSVCARHGRRCLGNIITCSSDPTPLELDAWPAAFAYPVGWLLASLVDFLIGLLFFGWVFGWCCQLVFFGWHDGDVPSSWESLSSSIPGQGQNQIQKR